MYSGQDTLAGGFPHSDIRGSTIARISPRLFAACHVLLRLLAPRHPPNALIALNTPPTPVRRTKPHIQASAAEPKKMPSNSHSQSNQPIRFTCQTARHPTQISHRKPSARQPSRYAASTPRGLQPSLSPAATNFHGDGRDRTDDPLLAKQVLSH
jgi:hypothetical protein